MTTTKNNEHKKLNVPNLRFPEFSGEWEKCALENLSTEIGDGIHATPLYDDNGTYYFVNGNNISEYGITITPTTQRVTEAEAYRNNANILCSKTILLSINGTIGNVALYKGEPIMLGKSACYINVSTKVNKHYIFHYLMMPKCQFYFTSELTGTTIKNLSLKSVRRTKVSLPNLKEQNRIAQLFDAINERIATQNKIIDKLQSLIKGISSRIFASIQGIEYRMGDIVTITNGNSNVQDAVTQSKDGLYPFFDRSDDIKYLPTFLYDKEAIIYPGEGTEFMPRYFKGKFALHQRCYAIFDFNEIINARFLYFYLKTRNSYFVKNAVGSTVPSLRLETFQKLKVIIPPKKIQNSVSLCLSSMEQKCNVEKKFLHKLLKQKQYLLRQMFI